MPVKLIESFKNTQTNKMQKNNDNLFGFYYKITPNSTELIYISSIKQMYKYNVYPTAIFYRYAIKYPTFLDNFKNRKFHLLKVEDQNIINELREQIKKVDPVGYQRMGLKVVKNPKKKNKQNPVNVNSENIRRWAYINLPKIKPENLLQIYANYSKYFDNNALSDYYGTRQIDKIIYYYQLWDYIFNTKELPTLTKQKIWRYFMIDLAEINGAEKFVKYINRIFTFGKPYSDYNIKSWLMLLKKYNQLTIFKDEKI